MNEEQKNIETCLAENILSEVASVPTDPQFRSLVEESFDPLQQQALRQAGYDGYNEVVMYHQPYTFTSHVKQMKSNLILLLRRLWRFPFGRGTTASSDAGSSSAGSSASDAAPIRSLADMWQHYITRLKGNPEYGIPSRLSQLTDLPSAPALLADRKMSSGIRFGTNPLPDGMSLAQLICSTSAASSVTEIVDDNVGWTMTINNLNLFPNAKNVILGCEIIDVTPSNNKNFISSSIYESISFKGTKKVYVRNIAGCVYVPNGIVDFSDIEEFYGYMSHHPAGLALISACANEKVDLHRLRKVESTGSSVGITCVPIIANSPNVKDIDLSSMSWFYTGQQGKKSNRCYHFRNCPNVECIKVGKLESFNSINFMAYSSNEDDTFIVFQRLIKFEIGQDTAISLNLTYWNPSVALDASRTDLIEEGSTATNNLQQFLSNFKTYIAERLTDKGTGLTLTLSQEVRNAIHTAEDEYGIENIIITKKGWTISPAPN